MNEREALEQTCRLLYNLVRSAENPEEYAFTHARKAWGIWQAALAYANKPAPVVSIGAEDANKEALVSGSYTLASERERGDYWKGRYYEQEAQHRRKVRELVSFINKLATLIIPNGFKDIMIKKSDVLELINSKLGE